MKSLLTKIISMLTIIVFAVSLCACNTTHASNENCDSGHIFVDYSYTAPTCKTNGEKVQKCSRCGLIETETLLPIDHDYQVKSTTPSTCTVKGSKILECSMCHETKTTELPCVGHKYVKKTEAATCFADGHDYEKCSVCGDKKITATHKKLTHNFLSKNETDYSRCANCGVGSALYKVVKIQGYVHTEWNGQKYYCYAVTMDIDRPDTAYPVPIPNEIPTPSNYYLAIALGVMNYGQFGGSYSYPSLSCYNGLPQMSTKDKYLYFAEINEYNYKTEFKDGQYSSVCFNAKRNASGNSFPLNEYPTVLKIDFTLDICSWIEI